MNDFDESVRHHYASKQIDADRIDAILRSCEPACQIRKWRTVAMVGLGSAALAVLALVVALAARPGSTDAGDVVAPAPPLEKAAPVTLPEFELIAIKIHADPCGRCKKIAPIFAGLQDEFTDAPVIFLTFDLSSKGSKHQAELLSETLGLKEVFEKHRRTGVIVVVSPDGRVRDVVDSKATLASAITAIDRNLTSG